jgi:hypothetical protein
VRSVRVFSSGITKSTVTPALGLLTPAAVHYGQAEDILRQRQDVLNVAYQRHPERFVQNAPKPPTLPSEVWINRLVSTPEPLTGGA